MRTDPSLQAGRSGSPDQLRSLYSMLSGQVPALVMVIFQQARRQTLYVREAIDLKGQYLPAPGAEQ